MGITHADGWIAIAHGKPLCPLLPTREAARAVARRTRRDGVLSPAVVRARTIIVWPTPRPQP